MPHHKAHYKYQEEEEEDNNDADKQQHRTYTRHT